MSVTRSDIVKSWYAIDSNLRKAYITFFIFVSTLYPLTKYLSNTYQFCITFLCSAKDVSYFKNLVVLFAIYVFVMMVVIVGYATKYLMLKTVIPEKELRKYKKEKKLREKSKETL
ncbi:hypothetical protein GOV05_00720 [Candidatus Woesearchaeota archaeon]|nr:hypothetical protein [Candidatus Woesearchaeota archaeon]